MFWFFLDFLCEETALPIIVRWSTSNMLNLLTKFTRVILLIIFAHQGLLRTKSPSTFPKTFRLPHFPAASQQPHCESCCNRSFGFVVSANCFLGSETWQSGPRMRLKGLFSKFSHNRNILLHRAFVKTLHSIFSPDSAVQAQFIWSVSMLSPSTIIQVPAYELDFSETYDPKLFTILRSVRFYNCLPYCEASVPTTVYHSTNCPILRAVWPYNCLQFGDPSDPATAYDSTNCLILQLFAVLRILQSYNCLWSCELILQRKTFFTAAQRLTAFLQVSL